MTTTEAITGQPSQAPPGATLDPTPPPALTLTREDASLEHQPARPEHDWPGSLFVLLGRLGVPVGCLGAAAVLAGLIGDGMPLWDRFVLAGILLAVGIFQGVLAKGVARFTRWAWVGAMAEFGVSVVSELLSLKADPTELLSSAIFIVTTLLWMSYFWRRRADFDVDIGL